MRIVVALGGNALLRRGEPMTAEAQRANVQIAAAALAAIQPGNELVITHGNGPQVGLLALQGAAYKPDEVYPLDVLGAQTEGMIGYMIEQELGNLLPFDVPFATMLTMVEVDRDDPGFTIRPSSSGRSIPTAEAQRLKAEKGWTMKQDGDKWRRVVASPQPKRIFEIRPIKVAAGEGYDRDRGRRRRHSTVYEPGRLLRGIEAVIDKDLCSELLARELDADFFIMATDADAVYIDWGKPNQRAIRSANPDALRSHAFPAGSMGPKVDAACHFARRRERRPPAAP